jgi:Holliday junction DNA helicase RuvB
MSRPLHDFHGFVGKRRKIEPLIREVQGAKARGKPACHMLLSGVSGCGKSTLARALAQEYGSVLRKVFGDVSVQKLLAEVAKVQEGDFLFIDEAQGLSVEANELLLQLIDSGEIEASDKLEALRVPRFTLLLATDQPGRLKNALRKRIPTEVHLAPYEEPEMKVIVERVALKEGLRLTAQAAGLLASTCHGLPRKAEHQVQKLRYYYPAAGEAELTKEDVDAFLTAFGIDGCGFGEMERKYLDYLYREGATSLQTLAAILGVDAAYVLHQVEHPLKHRGLITVAKAGRRLSSAGQDWFRNLRIDEVLND